MRYYTRAKASRERNMDNGNLKAAQIVTALITAVQNMQQNIAPPRGRLNEFVNLQPRTFKGSSDPLEADNWVKHVEKIFDTLKCTDDEKVRFAVFKLEENADEWWTLEKVILGRNANGEDVAITWNMFKDAFYRQYFPVSIHLRKEEEFLQLRQIEGMSVAKYQTEFEKLAKFATTLVATDKDRAKRFIFGLRPEIKKDVMMFQPTANAEALEKARIVEQGINAFLDESEQQIRNRYKSDNMQGNKSIGKREVQGQNNVSNQEQLMVTNECTRCGGNHPTIECRWITGACFKCGSKDHKIGKCPFVENHNRQDIPPQGGGQKQRATGRVYALNNEAANE